MLSPHEGMHRGCLSTQLKSHRFAAKFTVPHNNFQNMTISSILFVLTTLLSKFSFYGSPTDSNYSDFASYGRCLKNFYVTPNWTVCDDASKYI